jgi:hypothetical protein
MCKQNVLTAGGKGMEAKRRHLKILLHLISWMLSDLEASSNPHMGLGLVINSQ